MTIIQAFEHLLKNWKDQDTDFITRYRIYKSRYLNTSGKQKEKVSEEKMKEMLTNAGYTIKIKVIAPKK